MRSDYLDNQDDYGPQNKRNEMMGLAGNVLGFQTFGMIRKFPKTGRLYMPLTGYMNNRMGYGVNMVGRGVVRNSAGKLIATSGIGSALLGLSGAAEAVNIGMNIINPVWSIASTLTKPYMWPLQLAWFGGLAIWGKAAKTLQNRQYVDMGTAFTDSGATYTSRQRAVRDIAESHLQARAAIGNEAQLFHRSGG